LQTNGLRGEGEMATDFWNGTGDWSTDNAAWSDNSPPISTEDAEIQTGTDNLTAAAAIADLQVDAPAVLDLTAGATLSATGSAAVAGDFLLSSGGSASINGGLSITGNGVVWIDSPFNNGGGGSSLAVGGTLTVSSTNNDALSIGSSNISSGDTVTATALVNTGVIQIVGGATIQSTLDITSAAAGFGTPGVETGTVALTNDALLEFANGQIGTITGAVELTGANARIADAGNQQRVAGPQDGRRGIGAVGRGNGRHHGRPERHRQRGGVDRLAVQQQRRRQPGGRRDTDCQQHQQ
jgi:hypothetical protein